MDKLPLLLKFLAFCVAFVVGIFLVLLILAIPVLLVRGILRRIFPSWAKKQDELQASRNAQADLERRIEKARELAWHPASLFQRDELAKYGADTIRSLLKDKSSQVRENAADTLGMLRDEKAVPSLFAVASGPLDGDVRAAIQALRMIGGVADEALTRLLRDAADSGDASILKEMRRVLFEKWLHGGLAEFNSAACSEHERAVEALMAYFDRVKDFESKGNAAEILGYLADGRAIPQLTKFATNAKVKPESRDPGEEVNRFRGVFIALESLLKQDAEAADETALRSLASLNGYRWTVIHYDVGPGGRDFYSGQHDESLDLSRLRQLATEELAKRGLQ